MRALLLILTLAALLVACSENGDSQSDAGAESTDKQQESASGDKASKAPDLEAGQPVTKPTPPELESSKDSKPDDKEGSGDESKGASQHTTKAEQNKDGSGSEAVAASDVYDRYCVACHEQGMAGAPKLSNSAEWQKRIDERGFEGLVSNSWDGYRAMPAKGTCSDCSREELRATVEWMLDQAKVSF